jgi:tetratricopeptide (TPR) repeat protein
MRALVPSAFERWPDLVREHAIEILSVAPELKDRIGAARETLTSLAVPAERTRIYAAVRTRRLAHGLVEFLDTYAARARLDPLVLSFTDVDEADHTDQEFLAILIRRARTGRITTVVGTRGGELIDELTEALERHARPVDVPVRTIATDRRSRDELLRAYVESDGTSDDPAELGAYETTDPAVRAVLHEARAAELALDGDLSLRLGAIPYHLEHGADTANAGGAALLEAATYATGMGFWHAMLDYGPRGRAVVDPDTQRETYWNFSGKLASALTLVGRSAEAELLYVEIRGRYTQPIAQIFTGYAMGLLYTRFHPQERRDNDLAKAYMTNVIAMAMLLPDAADRVFNTVFHQNGLALVEMRMGNLLESHRLVTEGLERLERELPADRHRLHKSVLVHNRARVNVALGRLSDALADFTTVVELDPNYPDYYFDRADCRQLMGDTAGALADYDAAITITPPFWELHYNRADLRARLGDTDGAIDDLSRVVELEPDQLDARVNLVGLLLETDRSDGVPTLIDEGLRLHPGDARLLHVRGLIALESGDTARARRDFELALDSDPECVPALASRAGLAFDAGDVNAAIDDLTRAVEAAPDDADLWYNRGYAYQTAGRWSAAVDDYTRALELPGADTDELLRQRSACHDELRATATSRPTELAATAGAT